MEINHSAYITAFSNCLLSAQYVQSIVLGAGDTAIKLTTRQLRSCHTKKLCSLWEIDISQLMI